MSNGFILGQLPDGTLLQHRGEQHGLLFAPTGSGKDVSTVIPTLLTLGHGSVVVHDIKGEGWQTTAGWRNRFSHCLYFNPTSPASVRINPLLEVRKGVNEVRDMGNIADMVIDPEGTSEKRDHWMLTSHSLIIGTGLHVLYAEADKSLHGIAMFLSAPHRTFNQTLWRMMHTLHLGDRVHPVVASTVRECLNRTPNELSGILSTTMSFLGLYRDPLVARATSTSDFRWRDLQQAVYPLSLYLVVPPSDLSRTRPLMRLLLNQMGRCLTEEWDEPKRWALDLILNEFPALGHLEFFASELAYLRGYKIRALLVAQALSQLDHHYGQNNSILDNCHLRLTFGANTDYTAERISKLLATGTEVREQTTLSGKRFAPWYTQASTMQVVSPRPLLTAGEIMQLDPDTVLIMQTGRPPIEAWKIRYYEDPRFAARVLPPPDLRMVDLPLSRLPDWLCEGPKPVIRQRLLA